MADTLGKILRAKVCERRGMLVPGAANALSARIIADLGFEAIYISGAGVTNMYYGLPDLGFISLPDIAHHTAAIRDAVDLPLIVDADTGFGNALHVRNAVRVLERAGANAVQIEDQVVPKKCGHFANKEVIDTDEMNGKIRAAVDARMSEDLLIIARTDARAVYGFDAAIERAQRFIAAGADITFIEAPETPNEVRRIPQLLSTPQLINMVIGGKTPLIELKDLADMGFAVVLYANAALQGAIAGMQHALRYLTKHGRLDEGDGAVATFLERQRLVQKPLFDNLDKIYATKTP